MISCFLQEGLYLGPDHGPDHPRVLAGTPLYGMNLMPDQQLPELRPRMAKYIDEVRSLIILFLIVRAFRR